MSTPAGQQDVRAAVRALDKEFERLASVKDADGIAQSVYAEDAQLLAPGTPLIRGRAAIRDFWHAFMQVTGPDVDIESQHVDEAGHLAYSVGRYRGTIAGTMQEGKFCVVFARQDDGNFRVVVHAFNPDA
jgi:ketosteroid isomerase-like protein